MSAIHAQHVSLQRAGTLILDEVNWSVGRGEYVALLGPNGSGKTTLIRAVLGYEWPSDGTIDLLGERLGHADLRELRKRVAVVNPSNRFGVTGKMTAGQVVLTGYFATLYLYDQPTAEQRRHADHILDTVGLTRHRDRPFVLMSTGEQRRCLLARALVKIPEILILDEPTAGLDVAGREHLLATLERLRQRPDAPTIVFVTHHVEEISTRCDQVLMLREGRVAANGPPDDVISPEILSDVFGCRVWVQKRSGRFWLEVLPEAWLDLLRPDAPQA